MRSAPLPPTEDGSAPVAPPGDGIKLGWNSSGGPGATPPAKKDE